MNCEICQERVPLDHRSLMGCNWLRPGLRKDATNVPVVPGMTPDDDGPQVCPYYCASLPQAKEAAIAWLWRDKGQLQMRYDDPAPLLLDAIDAYHGAVNEAQEYLREELERRAKNAPK